MTDQRVINMIDQRLTLLEQWENQFAKMVDKQFTEYRGALFQCHNERFFLHQLRKMLRRKLH